MGRRKELFLSWSPLRSPSKQDSWLEAFSCPDLVLGGNSCSFGTVPRGKIDVQDFGPSLVTMQIVQLIVGVGSNKTHLLCCYEAYRCPLLQCGSLARPTSLWNTPVVRCLTPTPGGFLRVCGSKDTHLRDDTAKYLCAYIKIAASLEKKKKRHGGKKEKGVYQIWFSWLLFKYVITVISMTFWFCIFCFQKYC